MGMDSQCVQVWKLKLDTAIFSSATITRILSLEEQRQSTAFASAKLARNYVLTRFVVRKILGDALGVCGSELEFATNQYGKPTISGPMQTNLHFNVSHSGNWMVLALADNPVGIDIERVESWSKYEQLIDQVYQAKERTRLSLASDQCREFIRTWVAKEAVLKMEGVGLNKSMTEIAINFESSRGRATCDNCSLTRVAIETDYECWLATGNPPRSVITTSL